MKLTYEDYGTKITIENNDNGITMDELFPLLQQLCLGAGFSSDTVNEYFGGEI